METREEIEAKLKDRPWFKASRPSVRATLLGLGPDCNGYLEDLASRPDTVGGVRMIAIEEVQVGDTTPTFGIWTIFLVQNLKNLAAVYRYQYFSWKQGPASGAKGILLVRDERGRISHVIVLKGESFAVGGHCYDCPGGFLEPSDTQRVGELADGLLTRIKAEVQEEVGINLAAKQALVVHDLGRVYTDSGMTNNRPGLFAIEVDGHLTAGLVEGKRVNPDPYELDSGCVIIPVEALWGENGFVERNEYGMFHVMVLRLLSRGLLVHP